MRTLVTAAILLFASVPSQSEEYSCAMFSADYYKKTSPNGPSLDSMGVDFNRTIGVIVGAYQTAKKQPFNSAETAGLAEFEVAVADLCHKTPTAKALDTILSSAAMLALGDEASFSPDTRVGIGPAKIITRPPAWSVSFTRSPTEQGPLSTSKSRVDFSVKTTNPWQKPLATPMLCPPVARQLVRASLDQTNSQNVHRVG